MKSLLHLAFGLPVCLAACSRSQAPEAARISTVAIAELPPVTQGPTSLCWNYTMTGFLESLHFQRTGRAVDLSEGYLALWSFAHNLQGQLEEARRAGTPEAKASLMASLRNGGLDGGNWLVDPGASQTDALHLLARYGAVTQEAFPFSAPNEESKKKGFEEWAARLEASWDEMPAEVSVEWLAARVFSASLLFPGTLPREVELEGRRLSPQEVPAAMGFHPEEFDAIYTKSAADFDGMVQAVKKALHRGVPVPMGFSADEDRLVGNAFGGGYWQTLSPYDGHYVIVTDYKNRGGAEGALSESLAAIELAKHPRLLEAFVVRNSWGADATAPTGHYRLSKDFILSNLLSFNNKNYVMDLLLPRDLAAEFKEAQARR